jgi:protein SCO1/2
MMKITPPRSPVTRLRLILWLIVAVAIVLFAASVVLRTPRSTTVQETATGPSNFGGPFTLVGADGKPFSSSRLSGRPYAIYFGFTRCGDVCPTTLSRMVKLRKELGSDAAFSLLFVTIDPAHDGPKEVGQYAELFGSPIIGLTGSKAQIDRVKKQFGIYAQAVPNAPMGQEMEHSAIVLLFDRSGKFVGTITPDESDADALAELKRLIA